MTNDWMSPEIDLSTEGSVLTNITPLEPFGLTF